MNLYIYGYEISNADRRTFIEAAETYKIIINTYNEINNIYINNIINIITESDAGSIDECDKQVCNDLKAFKNQINNFSKLHKSCFIDKIKTENQLLSLSSPPASSSSLSMSGGNNENIFLIFRELYYDLDSDDINQSIANIYYNCDKLIEFYINYIDKNANDDEINGLFDTIILLLITKEDIINIIENKEPNIFNLMKDICSYLSLYNDSYILTLTNATVELIAKHVYDEEKSEIRVEESRMIYDKKKDDELSKSVEQVLNKQLLGYDEKLKLYGNKYLFFGEEKEKIIDLDEEKREPILIKKQPEYKPSNLMGEAMTPPQVRGGNNIANRYYIEYFVENPNKLSQTDRRNIRKILKDENYEEDLSKFIKSHLKL
jgi:hypothetical protein